MANYYASARSNYFKVKDEAAFREWAELWDFGVFESNKNPDMFAIFDNGADAAGWPCVRSDPESGEDIEWDPAVEVSKHLVEGQVAILMEAGSEKLRYISAHAIAIHSSGETVQVSLNAIYILAQDAFPDSILNDCSY